MHKNIAVFLLGLTLLACQPNDGKVEYENFNVKDEPTFKIEQKKEYQNPYYVQAVGGSEAAGAIMRETYVDEEQVKVLGDLKDLYPLDKAILPEGWPEDIHLTDGEYRLAQFKNDEAMPVVVTPDGTVFDFLIEEGMFSLNYEVKGEPPLMFAYLTAEIEKVE